MFSNASPILPHSPRACKQALLSAYIRKRARDDTVPIFRLHLRDENHLSPSSCLRVSCVCVCAACARSYVTQKRHPLSSCFARVSTAQWGFPLGGIEKPSYRVYACVYACVHVYVHVCAHRVSPIGWTHSLSRINRNCCTTRPDYARAVSRTRKKNTHTHTFGECFSIVDRL